MSESNQHSPGRLVTQSHASLYAQLKQAETWLSGIGIPITGNRFEKILENVDLICRYMNTPEWSRVLEKHNLWELTVSEIDGGAFVKIHEQFRDLDSQKIPRGSLKIACDGPLLPADEEKQGATVNGRNHLFALELAATLRSKGMKLIGFDDIDFILNEREIKVECKRLQSINSLRSSLGYAVNQIAKKIDGTEKRGIVAICIDKIIGSDKGVLECKDEEDLKFKKEGVMNAFVMKYQSELAKIVDVRILGVLLHFDYISILLSRNGMWVRTSETVMLPLCSDRALQFADSQLMRELELMIS